MQCLITCETLAVSVAMVSFEIGIFEHWILENKFVDIVVQTSSNVIGESTHAHQKKDISLSGQGDVIMK